MSDFLPFEAIQFPHSFAPKMLKVWDTAQIRNQIGTRCAVVVAH